MNSYGRGEDNRNKSGSSVVTRETFGMTLLFFSVILLLFSTIGSLLLGEIGMAITAFLLGTLGFFIYPFLLLCVYASIVLISGKKFLPGSWILRGMLVMIGAFLIAHLASSGRFFGAGFGTYMGGCWNAATESVADATAGGVLFGLIVYPLRAALTLPGAYVVLALLTAGAFVFFLLKTPVRGLIVRGGKKEKKTAEKGKKQDEADGKLSFEDLPENDSRERLTVGEALGAYSDAKKNDGYVGQAGNDPRRGAQQPQQQPQPQQPVWGQQPYGAQSYGNDPRRGAQQPQQQPQQPVWGQQPYGTQSYGNDPRRGAQQPQPQPQPPVWEQRPLIDRSARQPVRSETPTPKNELLERYGLKPEPPKGEMNAREFLFTRDPSSDYYSNLAYQDSDYYRGRERKSSVSPVEPLVRKKDPREPIAKEYPVKKENPVYPTYSEGYGRDAEQEQRRSPRNIVEIRPDNRSSGFSIRNDVTYTNVPKFDREAEEPQEKAEQTPAQEPLRREETSSDRNRDLFGREETPSERDRDLFGREETSPERDRDLFGREETPSDRDRDLFGREETTSERDRDLFGREETSSERDRGLFGREETTSDRDRDLFGREETSSDRDRDLFGREETTSNRDRDLFGREETPSEREDFRGFRRDSDDLFGDREDFGGRGRDFDRDGADSLSSDRDFGRDEFGEERAERDPDSFSEEEPLFRDRSEESNFRDRPEEPSFRERTDEPRESGRMGFGDEEPGASRAADGLIRSRADLFDRESFDGDDDRAEPPMPAVPAEKPKKHVYRPYVKPDLNLLQKYDDKISVPQEEIDRNSRIIIDTLAGFRVDAEVLNVVCGPSVTRYDINIPANVSVGTVTKRSGEIAMRLHAANGVNMYANNEKGMISIEVPNAVRATVGLLSIMQADEYVHAKPGSLVFAIGKDIEGRARCGDIPKMTHILVAGATNAGKSVALNAMLVSLICKYSPEELRLILIDPKRTEFIVYDGLPHLMINEIISESTKAIMALNWSIKEMERRYGLFEQKTRSGIAVRNIDEYNQNLTEDEEKLPKIVFVVDELADLMSVAKKEIEERIQRLTQKARAAGIHLVLATQRPSVDVITGVIKGNLPTRMAVRVIQEVDSRTILDESGAEKLLGMGDMLYKTGGMFNCLRVQGAFISSSELQAIVEDIKAHNESYFDSEVSEYINNTAEETDETQEEDSEERGRNGDKDKDLNLRALAMVVKLGSASISLIQRRFGVGYNHAGNIMEWMESMGYVSPFDGKAKARTVLLTKEEYESKYGPLDP